MAFSRSRERRVSGVVWLGAFSFCQSLGDGGLGRAGRVGLPADFERGRGHGGEVGGYGEDAVEFAVWEGCGHGGGDAGYDSVVLIDDQS